MKQIIPFKQELLFKTKINEITSISLEHTLSLNEDNFISGEFIITGDYKMTASSINKEKFSFNLPFEIGLDEEYDMDSVVIDIDNFYYEVVNNESLSVNIDIYIEGEKKVVEDVVLEDEDIEKDSVIRKSNNDKNDTLMVDKDIVDESLNNIINIQNDDNSNEEEKVSNDVNIFNNIDSTDTYVTYHVYIVKDEDTIDSIINKYNTSKEEISNYNDITNINAGDKLVIPNVVDE